MSLNTIFSVVIGITGERGGDNVKEGREGGKVSMSYFNLLDYMQVIIYMLTM